MAVARALISLASLHSVAAFAVMTGGKKCNYVPSTVAQTSMGRRAQAVDAGCTDEVGWRSTTGETCGQYAKAKNWCTAKGGYGTGWQTSWGTFAQNMNAKGDSAVKACCTCGGGIKAVQGKGGQVVGATSASPTPGPTGHNSASLGTLCKGINAFDKTKCACKSALYEKASRTLGIRRGASATSCATHCSNTRKCTGFELRNGIYCYLWLNNACSSMSSSGWLTSSSYTNTYVMKPACKHAVGRDTLQVGPTPPTRAPTTRKYVGSDGVCTPLRVWCRNGLVCSTYTHRCHSDNS